MTDPLLIKSLSVEYMIDTTVKHPTTRNRIALAVRLCNDLKVSSLVADQLVQGILYVRQAKAKEADDANS